MEPSVGKVDWTFLDGSKVRAPHIIRQSRTDGQSVRRAEQFAAVGTPGACAAEAIRLQRRCHRLIH
jgi:hypothetical protein